MLGTVWMLLYFAANALGDDIGSKCYSKFDYDEKLLLKLVNIEYQSELLNSERAERKAEFEDEIEKFKTRSAEERKLQQNLTGIMADDLNLEKEERLEVFKSERNEYNRRSSEEIQKQENITEELFEMKEEQIKLFETEIKGFREKWDLEILKLQELNNRLEENVTAEETNRLKIFETEMEEFRMKNAREIEKQLILSAALQGNETLFNFLRTPVVVFTVTDPAEGPSLDAVTFSNEIINEGGGYDTATGRFRCPVGGIYHFNVHLVKRSDYNIDQINCYIKKNGLNTARAHLNPSRDNGIFEVSNSVYLTLDIDDVVTIAGCYYRYMPVAATMEDWSSFSGYLVRPDLLMH